MASNDEDSGLGSEAGGGRLLGTNKLQEAIDRFDKAVEKLSTIAGPNVSAAGGFAQAMWTGRANSRWGNGHNAGGATFGTNFNGGASPFQRGNFSQIPSNFGGDGPPMGGGARRAQSSSLPNGGGSTFGGVGIKTAGVGAMYSAAVGYGNDKLPIQVGMDAYVQSSALGLSGNYSNNASMLRRQAFGSHNKNLNALAFSAQDSAAGMSQLQFAAGTPLLNTTAMGRQALGASKAFGYANQSQGFGVAGQMAAQFYSPQQALRMQMLGYETPRDQYGNFRSVGQVTQNIMQRAYQGRSSVNQKTLEAGLAQGGKLRSNLQAAGLDADYYGNVIRVQNQVLQRGGTATQAQSLIDKAAGGDRGAQKELQKFGVGTSDTQKLKNLQATRTGRDADVAEAFNKALGNATDSLNAFSKQLTNLFNNTPLGNAVGTGGAWGSQLSGAIGGMGNGALFGAGMIGASRMLGGGRAGGFGGGGGGGGFGRFGGMGGAAAGMAGRGGGMSGMLGKLGLFGAIGGSAWNVYKGWDYGEEKYGHGIFGGIAGMAQRGAEALMPGLKQGLQGADWIAHRFGAGGSKTGTGVGGGAARGQTAAMRGRSNEGGAYTFGGNSPTTGMDCAGLTQDAWGSEGVRLPRTAADQQKATKPVHDLKAGDLLFDHPEKAGHVGMYVGGGEIMEATGTGKGINRRKYDPSEWAGAGRPEGLGTVSSGGASKTGTGIGGGAAGPTSPDGKLTRWSIWQQSMWYTNKRGHKMADRGSPTQNHMDHVHWHAYDVPKADHGIKKQGLFNYISSIADDAKKRFSLPSYGGYRVDSYHEHDTRRVVDFMVNNKKQGDALNQWLLGLNTKGVSTSNGGYAGAGQEQTKGNSKTPAQTSSVGKANAPGGAYGSVEEKSAVDSALGGGGVGLSSGLADKNQSSAADKGNGGVGAGRSLKFWGSSYWDNGDNVGKSGSTGAQASGKPMSARSLASPHFPLGTEIDLTVGGKTQHGIVEDYGPADFVVDRHKGVEVLDLNGIMISRFLGKKDNPYIQENVNGEFRVTKHGKGLGYKGRKTDWSKYDDASPGGGGSNREIGRRMAAAMGWTGGEWTALEKLWTGESNWNTKATNKSSGAYGIPQSLPASKMSSAGSDWKTNPATQIKWGLNYIKSRYGSPSKAWSSWQSRSPHWYEEGGIVGGQTAWVGERGPELVRLPDGSQVIPNGQSMNLLKASQRKSAQSPHTLTSSLLGAPTQAPHGENCSHGITLNFEPGSIVIQGGGASAANNAREIVKEIVKAVDSEKMYKNIQKGVK